MVRFSVLSLSVLGFLSASNATPTIRFSSLLRRAENGQSNACGEIVRDASKTTFNATLVYTCLISVPFNGAVASKFLSYIKDSVQFHSSIEYLKNPPAGYQQPAYDLLANLDRIQGHIDTNQFANQYEFEAELQSVIYAAHDDHLSLTAGILGVFSFGTRFRIAAVSKDGIELPKVYLTSDLILSADGSYEPSPIVKLDGKDTIEYLTEFAARNSVGGLEGHADWNQLMSSQAQTIQSIPTIWGGGATFYPGDKLRIELANKTVFTTSWLGVFHGDSETGPLETGGDFYNSFVLGIYPASLEDVEDLETGEIVDEKARPSPTTGDGPASSVAPRKWNNKAYPTPAFAQAGLGTSDGGSLSAYYIPGAIAVLSVPSFQENSERIDDFSAFVTRFITNAKQKGVKKVVIDLQRNYGGDALLAFDMFKQFFPSRDPYAGSRLRAHSAADKIGSTLTDYWNHVSEDDGDHFYLYSNEWVASTRLNAETNQEFASWPEFYGPHPFNGGSFTTTQRYNLSDEVFDTLATEAIHKGFMVYGYGNRPANSSQPWAAADIVLFTDGICSSTCALFVEMMHHEAGVKTVTAGGRPRYGPMQAVGLSRGAASYSVVDQLDSDINDAQILLNYFNQSSNFLPNRTDALDVEVLDATINLRDQIRKGSSVPLQFTYDAADCRIFFTPKTFFNYTRLWQYVAEAAWTNPALCVKDSTGYSTTSANDTKLPPIETIPLPTNRETPPTRLGPLISSFLDPHTGIEAEKKAKKVVAKDFTGQDCTKDPGDSSTCPKNYYCDRNYKFCSKTNPGVKKKRPGCVRMCPYYGAATNCVGGTCRPLPEDEAKQLDDTGRGYCSVTAKKTTSTCTVNANTNVKPNGAGRPGKRGLEMGLGTLA